MKAIILAAGRGTRLLPFTLQKPKPLLEIKGKSILENMILHLNAMGVNDIIVVSGYKSEQFISLAKKLNFKLLVNENYENTNSIASLKCAIDEICTKTLILNGDLYLTQSFSQYLKNGISQFIAQKITNNTPSWGYIIDENCRLVDIDTNATNGYGDGIAFLDNKNDIRVIKEQLLQCSDNEYWEKCILDTIYKINFYVFCCEKFYSEIDSFGDALFENLLTPEEIAQQCSDDTKIQRLYSITNINYKIKFLDKSQVIRIPRNIKDKPISSDDEQKILEILPPKMTPKSIFFNGDIKLTDFLERYRPLDFKDLDNNILFKIIDKIKELHAIKHTDYPHFKPILLLQEIQKYEKLANIQLVTQQERKTILNIARRLDEDALILCHRDLQLPNILYNGSEIQLIDFEYSGFSSKIWELGNLSAELELNYEQIQNIIAYYGNINYKDIIYGQLLSNYIWALWGWIYKCVDVGRHYLARLHLNLKQIKES